MRFLVFLAGLLFLRLVLGRLFAAFRIAPLRQGARSGERRGPVEGGQMVKDPQCGTYVAAELAVTAKADRKIVHFCSEACRDRYLAEHSESSARS